MVGGEGVSEVGAVGRAGAVRGGSRKKIILGFRKFRSSLGTRERTRESLNPERGRQLFRSRGHVSVCPDGAPSILRTGSITA